MSYGTITTSSPSGTPSPSTSPSSTSSPETPPTCLDPSIMNTPAESSHSARSTPSHSSIDLPRAQTASKGGCWTCRLRRKKCDEQREGDTCQTCKRLTIKCLGWGARRPEWMRDKRAVDEYKAGIKEQLNRAGLIRGQPRTNLLNRSAPSRNSAAVAAAAARPSVHRRIPASEVAPSTASSLGPLPSNSQEELSFFPGPVFNPDEPYGFPEMPGASSSIFGDMYGYGVPVSDTSIMYVGGMYPLEPQLSLSNSNFNSIPDFTGFPSESFGDQSAAQFVSPGQQAVNIHQVLVDFTQARRLLFRFDAYGAFSDVTVKLIEQDPMGPVTKAVQALGQLHQQRMRVSQGMEPDARSNQSRADYFRQEALTQLKSNRDLQRHLTVSDAIAAFYLVLFSQLAGCTADWDEPFAILCNWLVQTRLSATEEPWLCFQDMPAEERLAVKGALWVDILASVTTGREPKFISLWRRLLGERGTYWQNGMAFQRGLRMDTLMGCPDEALLMIAEVSALARWKANAQHEGTLSYRELIRRGDVAEQRLKQNVTDARLISDINVKLIQNEIVTKPDMALPSDDTRVAVADLFREAAVLYLYTVLSGPSPGVPEIGNCVRNIIQIIQSLGRPPSEVERGVVLPITLAGCMTNDSGQRDFLRGRFLQNECIGNLMQSRLLMEILWQKRDVSAIPSGVSLPDAIREKNLRLLLM